MVENHSSKIKENKVGTLLVLYNFTGEKKEKESSSACERKTVPQSCLSACGALWAGDNYSTQFYGLFYEKLPFEDCHKRKCRKTGKDFYHAGKKSSLIVYLGLKPETTWVLPQHFLRTFCEEAEVSKTPELWVGRSKDVTVAITGRPDSDRGRHWPQGPQEPQGSSWLLRGA